MSSSFRLESHLLKNESFLTSIVQAWHQALMCPDATGQLVACIKSSRAAAKVWKRCNRAPPQIIQSCQFIIQLFDYFEENHPLSAAEFQVRLKAQERLQLEIKAKAAYWRQRSKKKHIKACDANTAYHHAHATNRMHRKYIRTIRVDGQEIASHVGKTEALSTFFKSIIGVPGHAATIDLDPLYVGSARPSDDLSSAFSSDELKQSVFAMNRLSAPGPDGFGPAFFYAAWSSVKDTVLAFADAFYNDTADLDRINRSYMVLLPKQPDAVEVNAFRPICLQNCALKIISKILTSRLQSEIPSLIDIQQTGFVKGRSISDTFIYAVELVQTCHKRKNAAIVLKLDFAKAFDAVSWVGLQKVLLARGFDQRWITWMTSLLNSSKLVVLVNGTPGPWITCKRGLRQGDPLSPYLFILVAETLQRMFKQAIDIRHPTDDGMPCVVLQYANDTLIVFSAEATAASTVKEILDQFADLSGLISTSARAH